MTPIDARPGTTAESIVEEFAEAFTPGAPDDESDPRANITEARLGIGEIGDYVATASNTSSSMISK